MASPPTSLVSLLIRNSQPAPTLHASSLNSSKYAGEKGYPKTKSLTYFLGYEDRQVFEPKWPRVVQRGPNSLKWSKSKVVQKFNRPQNSVFGHSIHLITLKNDNTCSPVERTSTSDNSLSSKFPYGSPKRYGLHIFAISCQGSCLYLFLRPGIIDEQLGFYMHFASTLPYGSSSYFDC